MQIVDLDRERQPLFAACLEDWSPETKEDGGRRARWVDRSLARGLRAKLALRDDGRAVAMLQYLPIEHSFADGEGLSFIPCIWVHGHPQGPGNCQGQGMGSALLEAAEADARARGARGMAAWGLWLPFWMRASWFKKHGYRKADRLGMSVLLYKPFVPEARPPRWFRRARALPSGPAGTVSVVAFSNGWCMAGNLVTERARRAAAELGERVHFQEIDTFEHRAVAEWGLADGLFVDGREVRTGPPPSYETIRDLIARRLRRL